MSVLAGAVVALILGSQANAAFNYDLRFTAAGNPVAPSADLHTVNNPTAGVYHLQLWAQISGNATLTDDSISSGFFAITSSTSGTKLLGSGSAVLNPAYATTWPAAQVQTAALADLNADGIGDWGSLDQASPTSWNLYQNVAGVPTGGAVGQQVNSTTWEVLVGTIDVNVANLAASGTSTFNVTLPVAGQGSFNYSGIGKFKPVIANIDGSNVTSAAQVTVGAGATFNIGGGANTPEPASLAVLGLGGLALLARRRK